VELWQPILKDRPAEPPPAPKSVARSVGLPAPRGAVIKTDAINGAAMKSDPLKRIARPSR
jgi:hypothetical protein